MPDQKPPRLVADERATLLALLQYQRDSLVRKVSGVEGEAARWSPVPSGTSLFWLITHMAQAETLWILHRFAGLAEVHGEVDREAGLASAVAAYKQTTRQTDAIVTATASLDETCRHAGGEGPANLRWVLMHLLEETARHAGHADVLRELIDGTTGR